MTTKPKGAVLTVGHSNIPFELFLANLKKNGVDLVVDVRSRPVSKYAVHFSAPELERSLRDEGLRYEYLGEERGGRPRSEAFYDEAGHVLYDALADSDLFFRGVIQLRTAIAHHRVAIMCSEEDPTACHRRLLIGKVLAELGYGVGHLRKDGRVESENELAAKSNGHDKESAQLNLLSDQEQPWRSVRPIRSVSPSTRPKISSRR